MSEMLEALNEEYKSAWAAGVRAQLEYDSKMMQWLRSTAPPGPTPKRYGARRFPRFGFQRVESVRVRDWDDDY